MNDPRTGRFVKGFVTNTRGHHPTHGMATGPRKTPEYIAWRNMIIRCDNPQARSYPYYGGRGITVAPEFRTFDTFFRHVGRKPPGTSLDRIDRDGHYAPGNVRWATRREQALNRSDNLRLTYGDRTQTLTEWSEETRMPVATLWRRYHVAKWPIERVLTEPIWTRHQAATAGARARWH